MRQESAEKEDMAVPYKLFHGWRWVKLGEASGKGGYRKIGSPEKGDIVILKRIIKYCVPRIGVIT